MSWEMELTDEMLESLYEWIDKIPLSRQKRRIERDFSDGYCVGEIIKHFLPSVIEMHNLTPAHNLQQKLCNWGMLNSKVFSRFGLNVPLNISQNICNCKPGYVEVFLYNLRIKIEEKLIENQKNSARRQSKVSNSPRSLVTVNSSLSLSSRNNTNLTNKSTQLQARLEYEEKVQECLKQAEEIEVLTAKVRRLEHLLNLKEARIQDLTERLDRFRPTGFMSKSNTFKSSSFISNSNGLKSNSFMTNLNTANRNSIAIS